MTQIALLMELVLVLKLQYPIYLHPVRSTSFAIVFFIINAAISEKEKVCTCCFYLNLADFY